MYSRAGFTIVELLVVIVVIGVLAAITIVSYSGVSSRAKDTSALSDLNNISRQLELFNVDNNNYPSTLSTKCTIAPDSASNKCVKLSLSNSSIIYGSNNSASPKTYYAEIIDGNNCYRVTNDTTPTKDTCRWIAGVGSLSSRTFVYYQDLSDASWATSNSVNCITPQCEQAIGHFGVQTYRLVSNNAIDFSSFPARNACKSIGGRLPTSSELVSIYNSRSSYGTFTNTFIYYSSEEHFSTLTNAWGVSFSNGGVSATLKNSPAHIRCVANAS